MGGRAPDPALDAEPGLLPAPSWAAAQLAAKVSRRRRHRLRAHAPLPHAEDRWRASVQSGRRPPVEPSGRETATEAEPRRVRMVLAAVRPSPSALGDAVGWRAGDRRGGNHAQSDRALDSL